MACLRGKTILALVASACTLLIVVGVLTPILMPKNNQASFGQLDAEAHGVLGESPYSLDVLFMGDSEVYTSLDPLQMYRAQGFTSYDVSTSAQKLPYTYSLLDQALQGQSPRVVVLETNMLFRKFTVDDALWRTLADTFPILEHHDRWKSLRPVDLTARAKATWTDPHKGFRSNDAVRPSSAKGYMKPSSDRAAIRPLNRWYLERIVERCREHGACVVLLSTPSTKNWNFKRHNAVQNLLDEHPDWTDVSYLDLNLAQKEVPIDWASETRDGGDHLNRSGAKKVSAYVGSWLQERYGLPDHRDDAYYYAWNKAAK